VPGSPLKIHSLPELSAFAARFILEHPLGSVVGLSGDLGAGKTAFVREIIHAIALENKVAPPKVTSPTFVIHQSYAELKPSVDHFDLYRLNHIDDRGLSELGFFDVLEERERRRGFIFIEWPERAGNAELLELKIKISIELDSTLTRIFFVEDV
jgi:tRNA threonylcarbamoyladenosine biosynthesis protein TsaE